MYTLQIRHGSGKWRNPTFIVQYRTFVEADAALLATDEDGCRDPTMCILFAGKPVKEQMLEAM